MTTETGQQGEWYVVQTYSGYENRFRENLLSRIRSMDAQDAIFEIVIPEKDVEEVRNGERQTVKRKMFQGYVLVRMDYNTTSGTIVRNTPGVVNFVGGSQRAMPLPKVEVERIFEQIHGKAPRTQVTMAVGDTVKIVDGPFTEFLGTVDEVSVERGRVRVMVSFFGRDTPVELDFLQVERVRSGAAAG